MERQQTQEEKRKQSQEQQWDEQFMVLQAMSLQQAQNLKNERKAQLENFYSTNKQYEISSWYSALEEFTFRSVSMDLTAIDGYILYWLYYNNQDIVKLQNQQKQLYQYYNKLTHKIDTFLQANKELLCSNNKQQIQCFMKLSTRSPKDLGYKYSEHQRQTIANQLAQHLINKFPHYHQQQLQHQALTLQFINQIYRFFLQLSKAKLKIKNSQDFVNIFSSSERIIIDISDLSFINDSLFDSFQSGIISVIHEGNYEKAEQKFIQLWAREWKEFQWYEELRCFYYDYELTGISQYDQRCYFAEIQQKSPLIRQQISDFFTRIKPSLQKVGLSEGVMDLVLFQVGNNNQEMGEIKLIEINVFNHNSRASLFSWGRDLEILTGKKQNELEVRILSEPIEIQRYELIRLMGMIDKGTEEIIHLAMKQLGLEQLWNRYQ